MKARYVNLPVEKLPHRLNFPEMWIPGAAVEVGEFMDLSGRSGNNCDGPWLRILNDHIGQRWPNGTGRAACLHLLELEGEGMDAQVEAVFEELVLQPRP